VKPKPFQVCNTNHMPPSEVLLWSRSISISPHLPKICFCCSTFANTIHTCIWTW